jgi:pectinesterase
MDGHVSADGWDEMAYTTKSGARVFLKASDARLYEFESQGPGARTGSGRPRLSPEQAVNYTPEIVLDDWRP